MKYTNKHMLPGILGRALERNDHKQEGKYSVSQLMDPPQLVALMSRHKGKMSKDVTENLWSLLGTAVHWIIEKNGGADDLVEQHLVIEVDGVKISGTPDHYNLSTHILNDWKTTAVYKYIRGGSDDWCAKLNIYAYMIYKKLGKYPKALFNRLILRDWQARDAKMKPDYPRTPFATIEQELWPKEQTESLIMERIQMHEKAEKLSDEDLPPCTREDIWQKDPCWAAVKPGAKRASKLFFGDNAQEECSAYCGHTHLQMEFRPGAMTRCEGYCPAKHFCHQYRKAKAE